MGRQQAGEAVYPPRYFTGFVVIRPERSRGPVRVSFANAPWLPLNLHEAIICPGTRESPWYSAHENAWNFPGGKLLEIQYAISVFNARTGRARIEKFNHPFDHPEAVTIARSGEGIYLRAHGRPLFRVYPLGEVMPRCGTNACRVVQFIA